MLNVAVYFAQMLKIFAQILDATASPASPCRTLMTATDMQPTSKHLFVCISG